ncbi:unnamed protein product [Sympodiomycopsis kandeliae]
MKGITKFAKRAPHMMTSRVGMSAKSSDAQFDDLNRRFGNTEKLAEKLTKDAATFRDAVKNMLLSGAAFGMSFSNLFQPMGTEYSDEIQQKHPNSATTIDNLPHYSQMMEELRETLTPEIELIESRVIVPIKEFTNVLKAIRKNITKRDHKLVDFDRINNSFTKLKEKKEKTLKDEQNLFKLEQEYEAVSSDYEYFNNALKEELPVFFEKVKALISPLFHSFYYMQLNVFYLTLDKVQNFSSGKYDLSSNTISVEQRYAEMLSDAAERLEELSIRKPAQASQRVLMTSGRSPSMSSHSSNSTGLAAGAPSRSGTLSSATKSPPPYSGSSGSIAKKPPPPPPPMNKPKQQQPQVDYVIALYDYTATADGDLSFTAGDRIQVTERTASTEDWWTGTINGQTGVFPGNYVKDA